jgi:inorganic triphosphatase YgiF
MAAVPPRSGEQELKLLLRPQDVPRLRARLDALAAARSETVDSTYLDTPDHRLARARAALRLRALGTGRRKRWVQTLKTGDDGSAFSLRGEWETPARGGRLAPDLLDGSPLARLLAGAAAPSGATPGNGLERNGETAGAPPDVLADGLALLAPVFRTCFERTAWNVHFGGASIEAVIDEGFIASGSRKEPLLEAELELKDGPSEAIWRLALELAGCPGGRGRADLCLLPYGDSKAARGYRLALGIAAAPSNARSAPALTAAEGVEVAARRFLAGEMVPLLANTIGLQARTDSEFVHQARVTVRRMRAGLDLLGTRLPRSLQDGLEALGKQLGAVRDWDVLCEHLLPRMIAAHDSSAGPGWARVAATAQRRQRAALGRLRRQMQEPPFAQFALRLLQWTDTPPALPGSPLDTLAITSVTKRMRRVAKAARGFARRSAQRQHRIRVQAKTLRYGIEILSGFLPRNSAAEARRALARFQDAAGRAQDLRVLVAAVERLTRSARLRRAARAWAREGRAKAVAKAQGLAARLSAWR